MSTYPAINFNAIQRVAIYQYARCNACIARYEKIEEDEEITFKLLHSSSNWTANFFDNLVEGEFFPDAFIDCDLVICLPSWHRSDGSNFLLLKMVAQDQFLHDMPVLICQGSYKASTQEGIALREELIAAGRYLPPSGLDWEDPMDSSSIIPFLKQLFSKLSV